MPRYKIHIDKPLPDKKHIARYKDFGGLYLDYEKATRFQFWRNLRTNPKYFATLVMVIVIGYLLFDNNRKQQVVEQDYVSANMPIGINYLVKNISGSIADTIVFESGTQIITPPFVFIDSTGSQVNGPVTLSYREFKDPADFFLAGIQLHADSVDRQRLLESAGMVEIYASWEGNPYFLKPGASIHITFLSDKSGKEYSVFNMDKKARFWRYVGKDSTSLLLNESEILQKLPSKPRPQLIELNTTSTQDPDGNEIVLIPKGVKPRDTDPNFTQRLNDWKKECKAIRQKMKSEAMTVRRFSVGQLGYFCIGKKVVEKAETQTVTFQQEKYEDFPDERSAVWVVQKDINTIRRCSQSQNGKFELSFYPDRDVSIWMNVSDINMGVVSNEKWKSMTTDKEGEVIIDLHVVDGPFGDLAEIKKHLINND